MKKERLLVLSFLIILVLVTIVIVETFIIINSNSLSKVMTVKNQLYSLKPDNFAFKDYSLNKLSSNFIEFQITDHNLPEWPVDIYENNFILERGIVFFTEFYLYDLNSNNYKFISNSSTVSSDFFPVSLYKDKILGFSYDFYNPVSCIKIYNISEETITEIKCLSSHAWKEKNRADIYENIIVWAYGDVYMYNLSSGQETIIHDLYSTKHVAIHKDLIAYYDLYEGVFVYNISSGTTINLANPPREGEIDVYGNIVVWEEGNNLIYMYNVSNGLKTLICNDCHTQNSLYPKIYKDLIVWENNEDIGNAYYKDIYMYNISSGERITISNNSNNAEDSPVVYDNKILWSDERKNGNKDVYMAVFGNASGFLGEVNIMDIILVAKEIGRNDCSHSNKWCEATDVTGIRSLWGI
jgi:hypothetical protein